MWKFIYFMAFLVFLKVNEVVLERSICRRNGVYREFCENIYIWRSDLNDFVSLFNVSLNGFDKKDSNSLEGKTIRVIADNMLPYISSSNYSQQLGGYLGDIWAIIQTALKFKTNVSSVYYDTGLKIIEAGEADVMLAAAVVKKGLLNVDYSQPYFYNWYNLFIKRPEAKASSSSYLKTFNSQLWFFSLTVFVILTVSVWLTSKFLNRAYLIEPHISIPSCFLGIVSGFINQGFDLKLRSYSGRMQVMFALIFGIVLYSAMNAVLVAQLAVFDTPFPFESLQEIAKKRTHSLCLRSNSFVYNNFTDENRDIVPEWRSIVNGASCLDINNQTNLATILCRNNLVILENRVVMQNVLKEYVIPCAIMNHQVRYFPTGNSFLLMKAFKEGPLIDLFVKKMKSSGVLQRLEYKWVRRQKLVNDLLISSPQVTIDHIVGILYLYLTMIFVSLLILGIEIWHYNRGLLNGKNEIIISFYSTK